MILQDDHTLIAKIKVFGDNKAFEALVKKYQEPIRRFFLNQTLGDSALSDDLAQETFIKAYKNIMQFEERAAFTTWLFRIAYNIFYDYTRKKKHTEELESAINISCTGKKDNSLKIDIYKALEQLTEIERICVTLQIMEEQKIDKIAEITNIAIGTVKSHLSRGKKKLALFLENNGYHR